ncbi:unnamed protein product [Prunus armeniaca]|uniref:Uncharacterized protein n=1 Tax=Prunus armeniaca TaxID=36596 RepID=A0A6J5WFM3_PRUAR|nr:unnamed protein product [Prunus armeniaca]
MGFTYGVKKFREKAFLFLHKRVHPVYGISHLNLLTRQVRSCLKLVVALREDRCPKVWVVTSDHIQQHAAHGAGAFIWSCNALASEIKASQKEFEGMLQEHRKGRGKTHTHGYYGGLNPRSLGSTPKAWANPTNTPLGVVFSAMISSPIVTGKLDLKGI